MGSGNSQPDGIEGEAPYWVHIDKLTPITGEDALPEDMQNYQFQGYIFCSWLDEKGKTLRTQRGTSAFERHTNYITMSQKGGGEFDSIMDFNRIFTQKCYLQFQICEKTADWKAMWNHDDPQAEGVTSLTLMQMQEQGLLGKQQTMDFVVKEPEGKHLAIAFRLTYTVGDESVTKPEVKSESLADMGNGEVSLLTDENGDGKVTIEDAKKLLGRSATHTDLNHEEFKPTNEGDDL